jgi:C4-dicarboxylate-specific signal transduction histidine kinase
MLDRAREFRSVQLNADRLPSLSRLAAGFAHELNNPASAAARLSDDQRPGIPCSGCGCRP